VIGRACSRLGEGRGREEEENAYRILAGKPRGKKPLGRPRHR
jgi:hypothetical protein